MGCRCGSSAGEFEGQRYTRCGQVDPPAAREVQIGGLLLKTEARVLDITAPGPLRIAAFAGPVGAELEPSDLAQVRAARPLLLFYLGGLGDDERSAQQNLASLAALRIPTLFVAGGEDRAPVIEAAFRTLGETEGSYVLNASGLREVRVGRDRFVIVAGAPFGRYALDEEGCGFGAADLEDIQAASAGEGSARTWLVSWHAPAGFGVSEGLGATELGSPDLQALASALAVRGGLFAYPEAQAGRPRMPTSASLSSPAQGRASTAFASVVPRLGRLGSQRADGSRLPARVSRLVLQADGLVPSP